MIRQIIRIDEEKCNGCGLCISACQEDAIALVNGKARLIREDYCDGLGNCLPNCPLDAITIEERETLSWKKRLFPNKTKEMGNTQLSRGCPGAHSNIIERACEPNKTRPLEGVSQLRQWPVQIRLAPVDAPYFRQANLLIAADCTAYAYAEFHKDFLKNKIVLIGCPKLDAGENSGKLTAILKNNEIQQITVIQMEVPCCGGTVLWVKTALQQSGKTIAWRVITITVDGKAAEQ